MRPGAKGVFLASGAQLLQPSSAAGKARGAALTFVWLSVYSHLSRPHSGFTDAEGLVSFEVPPESRVFVVRCETLLWPREAKNNT